MGRLLYEDIALQSAGKHTAGASSYVIAQVRARFASALGLEMKTAELIPNKMAGKPQAELRGQSSLDLSLTPAIVAAGGFRCQATSILPNESDGHFTIPVCLSTLNQADGLYTALPRDCQLKQPALVLQA